MNSPKLKVIIAAQYPYSRLVLTSMVQDQPDLELLDAVTGNSTLLEAVQLHQPDVLLADMTGLSRMMRLHLLQRVRHEAPVPVLGLLDQPESEPVTFIEEAKLGMYAYVFKPKHKLQPQLRSVHVKILDKLRAARLVTDSPVFGSPNATVSPEKTPALNHFPNGLIVIGASTGGIPAIEEIVAGLAPELNACILIAVHLPAGFTKSFARRLQNLTRLTVVEGKLGTRLMPNQIIIAPGSRNMGVMPGFGTNKELCVNILPFSTDEFNQPSVDLLMKSVAGFEGKNTLGILLTGMGQDGTQGLKAIQLKGGTTLVQDQASSVVYGMARSAIQKGYVQHIRKLSEISAFINHFVAALPASEQFCSPALI